jgi:AraC-like DNA-binding protein
MLSINTYLPSKDLKTFVRQYIIVEMDMQTTYPQIVAIPLGLPVMSFPFNHTLCTVTKSMPCGKDTLQYRWNSSAGGLRSVFVGQMQQNFIIDFGLKSSNLFVFLEPSAIFQLTKMNMSELTNHIIPLAELKLFSDLESIEDQFAVTHTHQSLIDTFEKMLKKRLYSSPCITPITVPFLWEQKEKITVEQLSQELGLSKRNLERKYIEQVGLTPKQLMRIARFREVVKYLYQQQKPDYLDAVCRFYYHDQSHLIKDFVQFLGKPPELFFSTESDYSKKFMPKVK